MYTRRSKIINLNTAVTYLVGANILMFILQLLFGIGFKQFTQAPFTQLLLLKSSVLWSQPWRLLTSMFLHGGFWHIFFNMYALLIFGPLIEQRIGMKRFFLVYFVAGLFAGIIASFFYPLVLGASGAIMGILGLVIMLLPKMRVLFFFFIPMTMRTAGILFALLDVFAIFPGIAHAAHLAGLAVGLLFGWYFVAKRKKFQENFAKKSPRGAQVFRKTSSSDDKTIELTKDELDEYFRYGKI